MRGESGLLGLVELAFVTLETVTVPKLVPKMELTSEDSSRVVKAFWPARAAPLLAPVKATELATTIDPGLTLVMVTLVMA